MPSPAPPPSAARRRAPWNVVGRYADWLHLKWPAGRTERLPQVNPDGSTAVPGLYVVGDLAGVPLLKFSADGGTRVVRSLANDPAVRQRREGVVPLAIVGGGTAGYAAALEAKRLGIDFVLIESAEPFHTIANFPKAKPIYTYPTDFEPAGSLRFTAATKEPLLDELREQTAHVTPVIASVERVVLDEGLLRLDLEDGTPAIRAARVVVAIGRSGDFRRLDVPGEAEGLEAGRVTNRLYDPKDYAGKRCLVVGGGDSALETAIALVDANADVTVSYRRDGFTRAKPANVEAIDRLADAGTLTLRLNTTPVELRDGEVGLQTVDGVRETLPVDMTFTMLGREAPLGFFRRSGVPVRFDWGVRRAMTLGLVLAVAVFVYHWKKTGVFIGGVPGVRFVAGLGDTWAARGWWPYNVPAWWASLGPTFSDPMSLVGTLRVSVGEPGFWYSLAYCGAVVGFGVARVRRRRTRYVTIQTVTLAVIQVVPLFLLPYLLLPWWGNNGGFDAGWGKAFADALFPEAGYGHGREYWRAFGLILAWPLFIWNVFTSEPLWWWLGISVVQTFVIIPGMIWFWGKGAYCGWICSCGALAETMGDRHREKMPHGPGWNRLNLLGQAFLAFALGLLALRVAAWSGVAWAAVTFDTLFMRLAVFNYVWFVDLLWAGILGVGLYWHFSGRVWCRFACPLAALMHVYHRFSRFAILADKSKCISCNVCTSVCHQGIDVMSFANKGAPMIDPQCVRCSACVQMCPTGVLSFGQIDRTGHAIAQDPAWLSASPVRSREKAVPLTIHGRTM